MVISQNTDQQCVHPVGLESVREVDLNSLLTESETRKIRIQLGSLSRLVKEHAFYLKESASLLSKIEEMRSSNACVHDIKQMGEVYADSRKMVPQVCVQLRSHRDGLFFLLEEHAVDVLACPDSIRELVLQARRAISDAGVILMDSPKVPDVGENSSDSSSSEY